MPDQPPTPLDTNLPFTRADAVRAGLGRQLRGLGFRQLLYGIYISSSVEVTPVIEARAALLGYGESAWASHATAARVFELPIPTMAGHHVTVSERKQRHSRTDVVCHLARKEPTVTVGGVRLSSPERLFVELAQSLGLVDLVVVGDHMLRNHQLTLSELKEHCAKASGPGAAQARAAVAFVRDGVDSPMETRLRMLIVLAGLPEPRINLVVELPGGRRRYDLSWPDAKLVVEYDGRHHIERQEQWEADLARRQTIEDDAWRMLVFTSKDIYRSPDVTLATIHRLLLERRQPGVPRRLKDAWKPHFPVRGDYIKTAG